MYYLFSFQHDCQEFLALLLDSLHEQLNTAGQTSPQNPDQVSAIVLPQNRIWYFEIAKKCFIWIFNSLIAITGSVNGQV